MPDSPEEIYFQDPFSPLESARAWAPLATLLVALPLAAWTRNEAKGPRVGFINRIVHPFVSQDEADKYLGRIPKLSGPLAAQITRREKSRIALALFICVAQVGLHTYQVAFVSVDQSIEQAKSSFVLLLSWVVVGTWVLISQPTTAPMLLIAQAGVLALTAFIRLLSSLPRVIAVFRGDWSQLDWASDALDLLLALIFLGQLVLMPVAKGGIRGQVSEEEQIRIKESFTVPVEEHEVMAENYKVAPTSPEDYTSFLSSITYHWMESIQHLANARSLRATDVWKLRSINDTSLLHSKFAKLDGGILTRLLKLSAHDASLDAAWKIVGVAMNYAAPALSKRILECIEISDSSSDLGTWNPRLYAFALAICAVTIVFLRYIAELINYHRARQVGMRIRSVLTVELFDKVLRRMKLNQGKSKGDKNKASSADIGMVVNLIATDINNLLRMGCDLHSLYGAPIEIVIATIFLYQLIGRAALAGISVLVIAIPVNYFLGRLNARLQKAYSEARDNRIRLTTEMVTSARYIKAQGLSGHWQQRIDQAREHELKRLWRCRINSVLISLFWISASLLVTLLAFYVHTVVDGVTLTIPTAFTALTLFSMLRGPLEALPNFLMAGFQAAVSVKRLDNFLKEADVQAYIESQDTVRISNGTFSWPSANDAFKLKIADLKLPKAGLVLVEGVTASGKSAFLLALLDELTRQSGTLERPVKISYAPQTAWLEAGKSVRDNVLFGSKYEASRYQAVVFATQLTADLATFPHGDSTRVATQTLSGGQKARLSLARALYSDAEVICLDDPLAAVDAHVQQRLIHDCILGPLTAGRLIILVTHHASALRSSAKVLVEVSNGQVTSKTQDNPSSKEPNPLSESRTDKEEKNDEGEAEVNAETDPSLLLHRQEKRRKGAVKLSSLLLFREATGWTTWIVFLLFAVAIRIGAVGEQLWIRDWGESAGKVSRRSDSYFVAGYAAILIFLVTLRGAQLTAFFFGAQKAGRRLHKQLLDACLSATPRWYDTNPVGRIVNRFVSDIWTIDQDLPMTASDAIQNILVLIASVGVISFFVPAFLIPLAILIYIGPRWSAGFIASTRDMQRIESTMASPIYSRFEETMNGIEIVRAFGQGERLKEEMVQLTSAFMAHWWAICSIEVWLSVRIGILGGVSVFIVTCLCLAGVVSAGSAGVAISAAAIIPQRLYFILSNYQHMTNNINSVERLQDYLEAPKENDTGVKQISLRETWPSLGKVSVNAVEARYDRDLPLVLKGVSFEAKPGERVGIIGRTGAGKTSITSTFLRLIELEKGTIEVDGYDLASLPLHVVRSRICICPQNPVLFSGTVRSNIDPVGRLTDAECLDALSALSTSGDELSLDQEITSGGTNVSAGQRQLISLARAIAARPKLLLLDEATSDTDSALDAAIQAALARLQGCTVIAVAHRLRSVIKYDKVLIMDDGRVVEEGGPSQLLRDEQSRFFGLCQAAGPEELAVLKSLAEV